ncbi:hypothetical protein [Pseudoalteromonas aurantia]|uniref:Uncharacterized protein n=1 Tax=Pseudoalteromonas aurantia 208 TaxID=1314867 RepID=A0ABR9EC73_9GAMM|nr:hypothetical protein [Pseudoalteromonas aurantia]MBE0368559.1 hypothetical protein [Pseudoalteromonas aurantia 208]
MLHYLITSQDYHAFLKAQQQIEAFARTEDISALCGKKPHPLHTWITKSVLNIVKVECYTLLSALVVVSALSLTFNLSLSVFLLLTLISLLFSMWVSGLAGAELLQHYLQCQDVTQDKENLLALYIEVEEPEVPQLTSFLCESKEVAAVKID